MIVGGGGLGFVEAQGEERVGCGTPDEKIILAGFADEVGSNFDDICFAHLQIEELPQGRLAESEFDGVEERAAGPGLLVGAKLQARGLCGERIGLVGSGGADFGDVERARAEKRVVGQRAKHKVAGGGEWMEMAVSVAVS